MQKRQLSAYRFFVIQTGIIAFMSVFVIPHSATAQSGRRTPPPASSTPTPTPEPTPQPVAQSKPMKARYFFRVMSDIPQTMHSQFAFPERMPMWFIERLKTSRLLEVESGGSASRKEAIKIAKDTSETFIIWLELAENFFANSNGNASKAKQGEIWINFSVFAPGTAKIVHTGTARLQPEGNTVGILGKSKQRMCYPEVYGDDYLLLGASLEAAERIMGNFDLPISPIC
jgi:hypothetical protein